MFPAAHPSNSLSCRKFKLELLINSGLIAYRESSLLRESDAHTDRVVSRPLRSDQNAQVDQKQAATRQDVAAGQVTLVGEDQVRSNNEDAQQAQ